MASYVKGLGLEFRKWVIEWSQTFAGKALLWMPQIEEPITTYYIYTIYIYSYLYFTGKKTRWWDFKHHFHWSRGWSRYPIFRSLVHCLNLSYARARRSSLVIVARSPHQSKSSAMLCMQFPQIQRATPRFSMCIAHHLIIRCENAGRSHSGPHCIRMTRWHSMVFYFFHCSTYMFFFKLQSWLKFKDIEFKEMLIVLEELRGPCLMHSARNDCNVCKGRPTNCEGGCRLDSVITRQWWHTLLQL